MKNEPTALISVDFINDIVDPKGKLAGKGYADFIGKHHTLENVRKLLDLARREGISVIHVRVGFSPSYAEHPERSPLFGAAKQAQALRLGDWATEFHADAAPVAGETVMVKHRVSAFYGTPLDLVLRARGIRELMICGVATDLAVEAAARDAHDRDYMVTVVSDCCAAARDDEHEQSLRTLSKIASVKQLSEI